MMTVDKLHHLCSIQPISAAGFYIFDRFDRFIVVSSSFQTSMINVGADDTTGAPLTVYDVYPSELRIIINSTPIRT